jgi:glycerophosphoryl diester phosphodiesterase
MEQFPENTVAALEGSAPHVDAVEVDVRRCGSGELVVFHDERLDRVTGASGRVGETSLERIRGLEVHGSGEGVPTLAEAASAVPDRVGLNVELKERGTAADAREATAGHGGEVFVSSFDPQALREARAAGFGSLAFLFVEASGEALSTAAALDCEYVHPHLDAGSDPEFVARAAREGFAVNAWTVRTRTEADRLREAGVDGAICDRYDLAPATHR